jgi:roadblock/LC7 domain-containing protein
MNEEKIIMHMMKIKGFLDSCDLKDDEKVVVLKNAVSHQENMNAQKVQTEVLMAHVNNILKR